MKVAGIFKRKYLIARGVAIAIIVVLTAITVSSSIVLVINVLTVQEATSVPASYDATHGISVGLFNAKEFTGVTFLTDPAFQLYVNANGQVDGTFGMQYSTSNPFVPYQNLMLVLPRGTTNIHYEGFRATDSQGNTQVEDYPPGMVPNVLHSGRWDNVFVPLRGIPIKTVLKSGARSVNIGFRLPSMVVRRLGIGRWQFQLVFEPYLGNISYTPGFGSAVTIQNTALPPNPDLSQNATRPAKILFQMCTLCSPGRPSNLTGTYSIYNPGEYQWILSSTQETVIDGDGSSGLSSAIVDAAPSLLFLALGSLIGIVLAWLLAVTPEPSNAYIGRKSGSSKKVARHMPAKKKA